jgi:membrane associated rhomboid family serine protease
MGIYDREYVRREEPRQYGGGARALGWSATTWLIVITVSVFVLDTFLPRQPVLLRTFVLAELPVAPAQIVHDFSSAVAGHQLRAADRPLLLPDGSPAPPVNEAERATLRPGAAYVAMRAGPQGPIVGWAEYTWMKFLEKYLHFSTERGFFQIEFWRLIGFQFLHFNLTHLLFNMIGLFFFGPLVERYLGSKRYVAFYLLCGIAGALMYVALNLGGVVAKLMLGAEVRIPGLLFNDVSTPLIGASAGVFGVLMAGAFLAPQATVLLFFILPMKLRTLAYGLVIFSIFALLRDSPNAGGEAGHLGGAIAGFYFIRRPRHLHGFFDFIGRADPTSHHYRDRRAQRGLLRRSRAQEADTREVDRILDKINRQGLQSLTDEEKRVLREASRER